MYIKCILIYKVLNYNEIKRVAKGKGISLVDLAEQIGYSYNGFLKAMKQNRLKHTARVKLNELLDIPLAEPSNILSEGTGEYSKITVADELRHINSLLLEQIRVKDRQIEMLTDLLKTEKNKRSNNIHKTG
jgi:hypothetical protein